MRRIWEQNQQEIPDLLQIDAPQPFSSDEPGNLAIKTTSDPDRLFNGRSSYGAS
jgi:hypothetical protein